MCGAVNYISESYDVVYLYVKDRYYRIIEELYQSNAKIKFLIINTNFAPERLHVNGIFNNIWKNESKQPSMLIVGFEYYPKRSRLEQNCWEIFYEQLKLNPSIRYSHFNYTLNPKNSEKLMSELNPNNEPYAFVHDDPSRGYEIDKKHVKKGLKIIENSMKFSPLHYMDLISGAEEVHCMESSFKTLVEIWDTSGDLFYHDIRKHPLGTSRKNWNVIKY